MQKLFLYRLFKYSKTGFVLAVLFISCYACFFYKKMDATFFPYNSMFTIDFKKAYTASTYAVKLNDMPVKITKQLYWKKDFLEASLSNYSRFIQNNNTVYMEMYLRHNIRNEKIRNFLMARLCPDKIAIKSWLSWYAGFAGYHITPGTTIELMQYNFSYENNAAVLKDSNSIYKTKIL